MTTIARTADRDLLELLRIGGAQGVADLAQHLAVTPTAVRQRLGRLLADGLVERHSIRNGRGRPKYRYRLTPKGLGMTGSNFTDLAMALWREVEGIEDFELRRTVLRRVLRWLWSRYAGQIQGRTLLERMRSLAELFAQRRVPFSVEPPPRPDDSPILTAHACPYPELADQDRTLCALERLLFSELLGEDMRLSRCRLDGSDRCQFEAM